MRTRTFASRLLLAIGIVAPTLFLSSLAEANPVLNNRAIEGRNVEINDRKPVNFAPNLEDKVDAVRPIQLPNGGLAEDFDLSFALSWDEPLNDNLTAPQTSPSAVSTFRQLNNSRNQLPR